MAYPFTKVTELIILLAVLSLVTSIHNRPAAAPPFNYNDADSFDAAFQSTVEELILSYDSETGTFRMPAECGSGWWNSANAFTAIALKDLRRGDRRNADILTATLAKTIQPSRDFRPEGNLYNDDHLWWLWFACEAAHLDPGEPRWLAAAEAGWAEVAECVTDDCGGASLTWKRLGGHAGACQPTTDGYKASIANSLLMLVSAKLFELTGDAQYRSLAARLWLWIDAAVVEPATSLVHDGVSQQDCSLSSDFWSYNTGVPVAALASLFASTRNVTYLSAAERLAAAGMQFFVDSNGVTRETKCEGDASCGCDGTEFRGVFVRGLGELYQVNRDPAIRTFLNRSMTSALETDSNERWQFQLHWAGPYNLKSTTITQIPVLDLFAATYAALF